MLSVSYDQSPRTCVHALTQTASLKFIFYSTSNMRSVLLRGALFLMTQWTTPSQDLYFVLWKSEYLRLSALADYCSGLSVMIVSLTSQD
eukprot:6195260-Pleurochrysis_carterae.AAC.1